MKLAYKILGFALLLLSPMTNESGNRFYAIMAMFTGALLLFLSKDEDFIKKYLQVMKLWVPLLLGVVFLGYTFVKLWFKFQAGEWPFVFR